MSFGPVDENEAAIFAFEGLRADFQYEVLKALKSNGISQAELAKRMGTTPAWVSQMLSDDANVTLESVAKVFAALKVECTLSSATSAKAEDHSSTARRSGNMWEEKETVSEPRMRNEAFSSGDTASFMKIVVTCGHGRKRIAAPTNRNGNHVRRRAAA